MNQNKIDLVMSKKYNLVVCHKCGKHFKPKEGFNINNHLICIDCYCTARFKTIENGDYEKL